MTVVPLGVRKPRRNLICVGLNGNIEQTMEKLPAVGGERNGKLCHCRLHTCAIASLNMSTRLISVAAELITTRDPEHERHQSGEVGP